MINDNGGEYVLKFFKDFIAENGIIMNLTAAYTPQQNLVAEIGNRATVEKACALLKQTSMPNEFGAEAVSTAVSLENLSPIASRKFSSAHEIWYGKPPKYNHLKVFGCLAYIHVKKNSVRGNSLTLPREVYSWVIKRVTTIIPCGFLTNNG